MSLTPPPLPVQDREYMEFISTSVFGMIFEPDLFSVYIPPPPEPDKSKNEPPLVQRPIVGFTHISDDHNDFDHGGYTNDCTPSGRYYRYNWLLYEEGGLDLTKCLHGVELIKETTDLPKIEDPLTHEITNVPINANTTKFTNMGLTYLNQYLIRILSQYEDHDVQQRALQRLHLSYIEEIVGSIILHNHTDTAESLETISHLIYRLYPFYICKENGTGGDSWYVFRGHGRTWARTTNRFTWLVSESMLTMLRAVNKIIKFIRAHYNLFLRRYQYPFDIEWRYDINPDGTYSYDDEGTLSQRPMFSVTEHTLFNEDGSINSDVSKCPNDNRLKRYLRNTKFKDHNDTRKWAIRILTNNPWRSVFPNHLETFEKFASTLSKFIKICANKSAMVKASLEACYIDRTPRFEFTTNLTKLPGLRSALAFGDFIVVVDQNDKMNIRTLLPEHYCLSQNNISYPTDASWDHPIVHDIINWLSQCFAVLKTDNPDEYDPDATASVVFFLIRSWARCLNRSTLNRRIIMMMGPPRGGKSQVQSLHERTFGSHCNVISPDVLGSKVDLTAPNPALVDALSGIIMWMTEAEAKSFNIELLKQITGGDTIRARGMYESGTPNVFRGIIMMTANGNPNLRYSKAFADRFLLVSCNSQWITNKDDVPTDPIEQLNKRTFLEDRNFNDRLDKYAPYFLWMLIDMYQKHNNEPLIIPNSIELSTKQMWNEVDTYCYFQLNALDPNAFDIIDRDGNKTKPPRIEINIPEDQPARQLQPTDHLVTLEDLYNSFYLFLMRWAPSHKVDSCQVFQSKIVRLPFMKPNYTHGNKVGWFNLFKVRKDQLAEDPYNNPKNTF